MKKKRIKVIILIGLLCAVAGVTGWRIHAVNEKYPNPELFYHELNEEVETKGGRYSIESAEFWSLEDIRRLDPEYEIDVVDDNGNPASEEQWKKLVVGVRFPEVTSEENIKKLITSMVLESGSWANGWELDLYYLLNNTEKPLQSGDIIYLTFTLNEFRFYEKDWENIGKRKFYLTTFHYPEKHLVSLGDLKYREKTESDENHIYKMKDMIEKETARISVEDAKIWTAEDIQRIYPECYFQNTDREGTLLADSQCKVLVVNVKIWKEKVERVVGQWDPLEEMKDRAVLQMGEWSVGWNLELYRVLNEAELPSSVDSEGTFLPFILYETEFSEEQWEHLEQETFMLSLPIAEEETYVQLDQLEVKMDGFPEREVMVEEAVPGVRFTDGENTLLIDSVTFLTAEDIRRNYPDYEIEYTDFEGQILADDEWKVVMVGVKAEKVVSVRGIQELRTHIELRAPELRANGWEKELYIQANPDALEETQEVDVRYLPFTLYKRDYKDEDWAQIEKVQFKAVIEKKI